MKKKQIFILILTALALCFGFSSCKKKTEKKAEVSLSKKTVSTHTWFYLTHNGVEQISSPLDAPRVIFKPWTESLRIAGIGQTALGDQKNENGSTEFPKAYALVNHFGILEFAGDKINACNDKILFSDITAQDIVFMNGNPVFSLYKNSFFNETIDNKAKEKMSVLVQFDEKSKAFFPIINTASLKLNGNAQVNDFYWDGKYWYYCIKETNQEKTDFSYIKWKANTSLLSIMPGDISIDSETSKDRNTKISIDSSSEKEFRALKQPADFSKAPERVKKLLKCLPENLDFSVECKTAGGPSARYYSHIKNENAQALEGKLQLSDSWCACLFKDGTFYFAGSLFKRRIINDSETIALLLPKLPEGFIYTDFGISDGTLYASWEETSFYETGRAGLLSVDLGKILYREIKQSE